MWHELQIDRFSEQAWQVLAHALKEARRLSHNYIGPEHLLLGLLREDESVAGRVLESLGATLDRVRAQTLEAILIQQLASPRTPAARAAQAAPPAAAKSNVVTCRIDDRDLDALDALIEAGVRSTRSDAAAWPIHAGIEANRALLHTVNGTVAKIRRLREVAQGLAAQVASVPSAREGSQG